MSERPDHRARILKYLEDKPDRTLSVRQIARWSGLSERTVLRHLLVLVAEDVIHEVDAA